MNPFRLAQACLLVQQLHYVLKQRKLDEPGVFIQLKYAVGGDDADAAGADEDDRWLCLGSLQKMRPIVLHACVHLLKHAASESEANTVLCLETVAHGYAADGGNRMARISTSHQIFHSMYGQRGDRSEDIQVAVWKSLPARSTAEMGNHFLVTGKPDAKDILGPSFKAQVIPKEDRSSKVAWLHAPFVQLHGVAVWRVSLGIRSLMTELW